MGNDTSGAVERRRVFRAAVALAMALGVAVAGACSVKDDLESHVDRYVRPYAESNNFSGVVLIARDGRPTVLKAYGYASYELSVPNRPETRFHIASVSKTFTAAAILLLQQHGRLDVHDTVGRHISGYPNGDRLTLHHLLTHTSGISNVNDLPQYDGLARVPQALSDIVGLFRDQPLEFEPGTRYSYSNSNYNLLALVIEQVSGETYGSYLSREILQPLGLRSTGHDGDIEAVVPGAATGYAPDGLTGVRRAPFLDWTIKTGNGSLYSTAADLLRWTRAIRSPGLFTARTLELMLAEHVDGIGYGWFVRKGDRPSVAMTGRSPGFSASVEQFLDKDVTVILVGNLYSGVTHAMARDLGAVAFGDQRTPLVPAEPVRVTPARVDECVGLYRFGDDFTFNPGVVVRVERDAGTLRMHGSQGMGTSSLVPLRDGTFLDRLYGGRVTFGPAADGRAKELLWNFGRDFRARRQP